MSLYIQIYCSIRNNKATLNGNDFFAASQELEPALFLSALYKSLQLDYRKFFKMDKLSKLGFLASELLLKDEGERAEPKENMHIILWNSSASLDADMMYQTTIEPDNYFPSPADFVYTLPNIVTGEIAIRNKIFGETSFYISQKMNAQRIYDHVVSAFLDPKVQQILCGWTEYLQGNYEAVMYLIERNPDRQQMEFTVKNIMQTYNNK